MWICAHACCIFAPREIRYAVQTTTYSSSRGDARARCRCRARECSRVMHGPAPRAGASSTVRPAYPTRNLSCWAWWRLGKSSLPQVRAARFVRVRTAAVLHAAGRHRHTPSPRPHFSPGIIMTIAFGGLLGSTFPVLNQTAFYLVVVRAAAAVAHDGGCVVVCVCGGVRSADASTLAARMASRPSCATRSSSARSSCRRSCHSWAAGTGGRGRSTWGRPSSARRAWRRGTTRRRGCTCR
jgi:hypothetical protein